VPSLSICFFIPLVKFNLYFQHFLRINLFLEGIGTYTSASGDKYFGQWKDGKTNGFGIFYFSPNNSNLFDSYEGEWFDNKKHGNGILTWAFGDRYEGTFLNARFL